MGFQKMAFATIAMVVSLALAGCETASTSLSGASGGLRSRSQMQLATQTADYKRTVVEGVQAGVIIGALGAAAVTALSGGDGRKIARNAALGGLIGGVIGGAAGHGVAENKKRYVQKEDALSGVIRQASANNSKLSRMVDTANALVRERRAQAASLDKSEAQQKRELKAAIAGDQRTLSEAIGVTEREISQLQSLKSRYAGNATLNTQINATRAKKEQLDRSKATLTDIRETLE